MQCWLQLLNSQMSCCLRRLTRKSVIVAIQGRCVYGDSGESTTTGEDDSSGWTSIEHHWKLGRKLMLWIKNTSDYFTILTKECLKKYGQQYLPVTVAGDDG